MLARLVSELGKWFAIKWRKRDWSKLLQIFFTTFKFADADSVVAFTRRLRQASAASRNGSGPNWKRKKWKKKHARHWGRNRERHHLSFFVGKKSFFLSHVVLGHFANLTFRQLDISSTWHFIKCKLYILLTHKNYFFCKGRRAKLDKRARKQMKTLAQVLPRNLKFVHG